MTIEIIQDKKKKRNFFIWVTINNESQLFNAYGVKQLKEVINKYI